MYRYSPRTISGSGRNSAFRNRLRSIALIVLAVALTVTIVLSWSAFNYRSRARELYLKKAIVECADALALCNTLSRTAGSGTAETLGQIRSRVYAINTLSNVAATLGGNSEAFASETQFTKIYDLIGQYSDKLITGMNTSTFQNDLTSAITLLQAYLAAV